MPSDYSKILKFKSHDDIKRQIDAYFEDCEERGKPLTITGLAIALDTNRQTLLEYEGEVEGREKVSIPEEERKAIADAIKKAKQRCENYAEQFLFSGKQIVGAIFNLKNNYGWKDKSDLGIEPPVGGIKIEIVSPTKDDKVSEDKSDNGIRKEL